MSCLAAAVRLPERRLLAAAREAVGTGLLAATADGYAFTHTLIRQVIYAELLPGERRRLHRRLAEAAGRAPAGRQIRPCWPSTGIWPGCPDRAAAAAVLAARQAVSARAYPEAEQCYGLAIELARWLPERVLTCWRRRPGRRAGRATPIGPRPGSRMRWRSRLQAGFADQARLLERLGRYRWEAGDPRAAVEATEQAMALLGTAGRRPCRPGCWPRWPPGGCCSANLPRPCRWPRRAVAVARAGRRGRGARARAWRRSGSSRPTGRPGRGAGGLREPRSPWPTGSASIEDVGPGGDQPDVPAVPGRAFRRGDRGGPGRPGGPLRSMDAPPALTAVLDNNTAAVLVATGQWAEAERLLAELIGESRGQHHRYLQLLSWSWRWAGAMTEHAAELAEALRKSPRTRRITRAAACLPGRAGAVRG